jgi:hypothetical protein
VQYHPKHVSAPVLPQHPSPNQVLDPLASTSA